MPIFKIEMIEQHMRIQKPIENFLYKQVFMSLKCVGDHLEAVWIGFDDALIVLTIAPYFF